MSTQTVTPTPGFRVRIGVYFTVKPNGGRRAWRWSPSQLRSFPIALATAELLVAQGHADELPGHPLKPAGAGADITA